MNIAAPDRYGGLTDPTSGHEARPNKNGVMHWPDSLSDYAEAAHKTGRFIILGRRYGGFGPGKMKKPYRTAE